MGKKIELSSFFKTNEEGKKGKLQIYELIEAILDKTPIKTTEEGLVSHICDNGCYRSSGRSGKEPLYSHIKNIINGDLDSKTIGEIAFQLLHHDVLKPEDIEKLDKNWISVKNGLYNLKTKDFVSGHEHSSDIYKTLFLTWRINANYDPSISPDIFNNYLGELVENTEKLQDHIGDILAPHYLSKKLLFMYGPPNSGKTSFGELLTHFAGGNKNCSSLNLHQLGERFTASAMFGKVLNINTELDHHLKVKQCGRIKAITGGDGITMEFKGVDSFTHRSRAKQFFGANDIPPIDLSAVDDAFYRRFDFIEFPNVFQKKELIEDMKNNEEFMSSMLNSALEGYYRIKNNNWEFTDGCSVKEVKDLFEIATINTSPFNEWLNNNYKINLESIIPTETLWKSCRAWHIGNDHPGHSYLSDKAVFGRMLSGNKFMAVKRVKPRIGEEGKQVKCYQGIEATGIEINTDNIELNIIDDEKEETKVSESGSSDSTFERQGVKSNFYPETQLSSDTDEKVKPIHLPQEKKDKEEDVIDLEEAC